MIKIWFLIVLLSIFEGQPLVYRGFLGYGTETICLQKALLAEELMRNIEFDRGHEIIWMESFCLPFDVFKVKKKTKKTIEEKIGI